MARFSDTLNNRDAQLRNLLANANKVTAVLAKRSDQIASLVVNTNALLAELLSQRNSVDALFNNLTAVSHQISGLVNDNRTQLKPAVDKLNGVLAILDNRKKELQRTLYLLRRYAMSFGEVLGAGPFFKASLVNLARANSPSRSSTPRSPISVLTPMCCCRRNWSTLGSASRAPRHCRCPIRAPGRAESRISLCPMPLRANPRIRGAARPACRCPARLAAIRTANPCLRPRQVGLHPVRPRWGLHPANCRRLPSGHPSLSLRAGGNEYVCAHTIAIATTLVVILAVAITVVAHRGGTG